MSRIPVIPRESPRHQQAREQRKQLNEIATQLVACWRDLEDDPLAVEVLRGVALAQSIDDAHPIDRHGRCRRWRCTRRWLFIRQQCPTRLTLNFCRTADTVTLWFHVLNQLPNLHLSLATVRTWLTQRHTKKPETDEPKHDLQTMHSTVE
jgi:hypothetical protein